MTTLPLALEEVTPLLRAALAKAARPTVPFEIRPYPHALATVPGSLAPYLNAAGAPELPYPNVLAAVLGDALPSGPNSRAVWPSQVDADTARKPILPFNAPLWTSKLGGFGYLPRGFPYPRHTEKHTPLQLLLQLNLSELSAQCAAFGKGGGAQCADGGCFLSSPPWPTKGILAVYTDPFDFCWGCNFTPRDPQNGFRFLYFETDYEEKILPLLRGHLDGKGKNDCAALEEGLSALMWSREEQFDVFAQALDADSKLLQNATIGTFAATQGTEEERAQLERDRHTMAKVGWLLAHGTATPTNPTNDGTGVQSAEPVVPQLRRFKSLRTSGRLWYGSPTDEEFVVTVNTARMAEEVGKLQALLSKDPALLPSASGAPPSFTVPLMVPTRSVEFNQLVLYRALRGPHGREVLRDIKLATAAQEARLAQFHQHLRERKNETPADDVSDSLDEVNVQLIAFPDFRSKRLDRLSAKRTKGEGAENDAGTEAGKEEKDEEGTDDWDEYELCFQNQIGGYPSFTQEDPRYMAYRRHDGGFKPEEGAADGYHPDKDSGMLIFPEKRQHGEVKGSPDGSTQGQQETGDTEFMVQRDAEDGAVIADYCLFQLAESSDIFMVGDAGIANAFIAEKDLRERRFDRAWLTYDCC